jgi:hypothetical protein
LQGRKKWWDLQTTQNWSGQRISSNHTGFAPPGGCDIITRYCEGSNGEFGVRYFDHHLTVCCCRLWVPAGEHDKTPSSIVHTYYLLKSHRVGNLAGAKDEWGDDWDIPCFY